MAPELGIGDDEPVHRLTRLRTADDEDARLLGIRPGAAVLSLQRVSRCRGRAVEFTTSSYRGDR